MKTLEQALADIDPDAPLQEDLDALFLAAVRTAFGYRPAAPTVLGEDQPPTVLH
jgi:hypothetical protein